MAYRESLEQVQAQRQLMKLSPSRVRFVKMLEMTGPEIEEEVRREVDDNPALEVVDDTIELNINHNGETAEEMQRADYPEEDIPVYRFEARRHSIGDTSYEPVAVAGYNLMDYLLEQLAQSGASREMMDIAPFIIGNLDSNGYLQRNLNQIADDIAMSTGVDVDMDVINAVFQAVRASEPAGIGATDLRDCLLLQLYRREPGPRVSLAIKILEDNFETFSRKHYDRLASTLGVDNEQLALAIELIRTLNPKPAAAFDGGADNDLARVIVPDFSVEVDGDILELYLLNNIPELRIDAAFAEDTPIPARAGEAAKAAVGFITERRENAETFIKLLKLRQETLFRVMAAIMKIQRDFFLTDDESLLKPMILKDVAELTGYDLSVISRATAAKYVTTRSGIYPLKFFFNERIASVDTQNNDTSSRSVMAEIKRLIDEEDSAKPLSDSMLTKMLNDAGINVARRTVAKYREQLHLPVARLRRKIN